MGALGAFLRGVGGPGLIDQAQYMRRQQEIETARAERQRELDESRKWREEQAEADRQARAERAAAGGGSRSGGGGGSAAEAGGEQSSLAIARLMQGDKEAGIPPMSRAEAARIVEASMTGENPLTAVRNVPQQIDDGDRMRTVTTETTEPDVERWLKLNRMIGKALEEERPISKSNFDQYQGGLQKAAVTAGAFSGEPAQERGALLAQGKSPFDAGGSSVLTGAPAPGSVDAAKIPAEGALANQRNASAAKDRADINRVKADMGGNIKSATPERLTTTLNAINGLIRTFDENSMDDASRAQRTELQQMARGIAAELNRRGLGNAAPAAPTPAGKPASTIKALPPGAKQIGTSKGRPVYQTPDGKRFIGG